MAKHQQHVEKNLGFTREFVPSKLSNYTVEEPVRQGLEKTPSEPTRIHTVEKTPSEPMRSYEKPQKQSKHSAADDFKLLMKCVKLWKKYTRYQREAKRLKKVEMSKFI